MNCDDFMLLVAKEGSATPAMGEHLESCEACRELKAHLAEDDASDESDRAADEEIIGQQIGPYQVTKLLGAGGMGRVYLGVHPEIGSRVAIKVFSKDWNVNRDLVARFFAEAKATNLIGHENIVNVLDVGRLEDGRPYMVMEHLPGSALSALIGSETLTDSLVSSLMLDVLSALSAAHDHQIVHRDLKPDNIFVSPEGRATLLDFGVAKLVTEAVPGSAPTATGTVLGTPHYMSPEQATGDPVDTRSDVYAMGVMLYECFTGRRPFQGTSLYRLMDQQVNVIPIRPREIRPDLSESVDNLIMKALEKSPAMRFATPGDMHKALSACAIGSGSGALAASAWDERDNAETAATMAQGPRAIREEEEQAQEEVASKASAPRPMLWLGAAGAAIGAVAVVFFIGSGNKEQAAPMSSSALLTANSYDAAVPMQVIADANQTDAAVPDAQAPDAAPPRVVASPVSPPPKTPRLGGTAPLSLLAESTRLAREKSADAVLTKIIIYGLNEEGRVDLKSEYAEITFDFYSATLAAKAGDRKRGHCLERVTYKSSLTPQTMRKMEECAALRVLPPPNCSMKKLLEKGRQGDDLPAQGTATRLYLEVPPKSTSGRSRWTIEYGHRRFSVYAC